MSANIIFSIDRVFSLAGIFFFSCFIIRSVPQITSKFQNFINCPILQEKKRGPVSPRGNGAAVIPKRLGGGTMEVYRVMISNLHPSVSITDIEVIHLPSLGRD